MKSGNEIASIQKKIKEINQKLNRYEQENVDLTLPPIRLQEKLAKMEKKLDKWSEKLKKAIARHIETLQQDLQQTEEEIKESEARIKGNLPEGEKEFQPEDEEENLVELNNAKENIEKRIQVLTESLIEPEEKPEDPFDLLNLPEELIFTVLAKLNIKELIGPSATNKKLRRLALAIASTAFNKMFSGNYSANSRQGNDIFRYHEARAAFDILYGKFTQDADIGNLIFAILNDDLEKLKNLAGETGELLYLLEVTYQQKGKDPVYEDLITLLFSVAIDYGRANIIRFFLSLERDFTKPSLVDTFMVAAINNRDMTVLSMLMEKLPVLVVGKVTHEKWINLAATCGNVEVFQALAKGLNYDFLSGFKPDEESRLKSSVMTDAISGGSLDIVKMLFDEIDSEEAHQNKWLILVKPVLTEQWLTFAIKNEQFAIADFLIKERGATPSVSMRRAAIQSGNLAQLQSLIARGYCDVNQQDLQGQTSLDYARSFSHPEIIHFLLEQQGESRVKNDESNTNAVLNDLLINELKERRDSLLKEETISSENNDTAICLSKLISYIMIKKEWPLAQIIENILCKKVGDLEDISDIFQKLNFSSQNKKTGFSFKIYAHKDDSYSEEIKILIKYLKMGTCKKEREHGLLILREALKSHPLQDNKSTPIYKGPICK